MQINLGHLRYFIVVAEELHFGRAAARLNIAQPPLSQQISRLEKELEVRLFERKSRRVELTAAGQSFLAHPPRMLVEFEDAGLGGQGAHRGEPGRRVIRTIPIGLRHFYDSLLPAFRTLHTDVRLTVRSMSTVEQIRALHNGQIDIALIRLPVEDPLIEVKQVFRDPLVVAMPARHRLAKLRSIPVDAVVDEPQVMFVRARAPDYYDFIVNLLKRPGKGLYIAQEAEDFESHMGMVAAGFGLALVPGAVRHIASRGVVYRPLRSPTIRVESALAVLKDRETAVIHSFLQVAAAQSRR